MTVLKYSLVVVSLFTFFVLGYELQSECDYEEVRERTIIVAFLFIEEQRTRTAKSRDKEILFRLFDLARAAKIAI